ncbi:Histone deacetylase 8 [Physocladia obscura]|uniref:histone deacetylase n=1 Tax=Physocladia obscura TaxID=109957 RepID=A0AAD5SVG6_9FUNG|nr:Histone deacetylase 8 [Physocladia obscura]
MKKQRVGYIYSQTATVITSKLPSNIGRSRRVHALALDAFAMHGKLIIVPPVPASRNDFLAFHSIEFVNALMAAETQLDEMEENFAENLDFFEEFGLLYDCPVFPGLAEYVRTVAGGTLTATRLLINREADVAIHWDGGRHHAHREMASGFCYINDIVLGILDLHSAGFKRVLYIDLDIHHCDGVESAFEYTSKVFRASFHMHQPGFFPGTGSPESTGVGKGANHALNTPLPPHTTSHDFIENVTQTVSQILEFLYSRPDALVVQCGMDGCRRDPLVPNGWNLDAFAVGDCVAAILQLVWPKKAEKLVPVLLLGGGGYDSQMAARGWTYTTMRVLEIVNEYQDAIKRLSGANETLSAEPEDANSGILNNKTEENLKGDAEMDYYKLEIPDHEFGEEYAPHYTLYESNA